MGGISLRKNSLIINTQNSENLLVGAGFGMMLNSVSSVFFMKQLDFLLLILVSHLDEVLGIDLVLARNTYFDSVSIL